MIFDFTEVSSVETSLFKPFLQKIETVSNELETHKILSPYAERLKAMKIEFDQPLLIMVMGEFSTGKSTFINALIGQEVARMDAKPTTAVITKLVYGNHENAVVYLKNGTQMKIDIANLAKVTAEGTAETDAFHDQIDYVEVALPIEFLKKVNIIDSPGLNADKQAHIETTTRFMNKADTVLWLFSVDAAGKSTEIKAIKELSPRLKPFAIVNKIDEIDEEEDDVEDVLETIRLQLKNHVTKLIGVSAKQALEGKLQNNQQMLAESNFKEVDNLLATDIASQQKEFKFNSLLESMSHVIAAYDVDMSSRLYKFKMMDKQRKYLYLKKQAAFGWRGLESVAKDVILIASKMNEEGNISAQLFMGIAYYTGMGVEKDLSRAVSLLETLPDNGMTLDEELLMLYYSSQDNNEKFFYWAKQAAEQDNAAAQLQVAACYLEGIGTEKNLQQAIDWAKKSASNGSLDAEVLLGLCYEELGPNHLQNAYKCYQHAANHGSPFGLNRVGLFIDEGKCVQKDSNLAFQYFKISADKGDLFGAYNLARCYSLGIGVQKDENEAFKYFTIAARRKEALPLVALGCCYRDGVGTKIDKDKAMHYFDSAAQKGSTDAMICIGNAYLDKDWLGENQTTALSWYKSAAEKGSSEGQYLTGVAYFNGLGTSVNNIEAKKWLKAAADQGHAAAQSTLGDYYRLCEEDEFEALEWYKAAAKQGEQLGQCRLGEYYYQGLAGLPVNYTTAYNYFKQAAEQEHMVAQYMLGVCYAEGKGTSKNGLLAVEWLDKAISQGYLDAKKYLADVYWEGTIVQENKVRAIKLYQDAAEQGDVDSQAVVGIIYSQGIGVRKNLDKGIYWLEKAAQYGNPDTENKLGIAYSNKERFDDAAEMYKRAAAKGYAWGQYNLGICYANGSGVPKNKQQAKIWLQRAADQGINEANKALKDLESGCFITTAVCEAYKKADDCYELQMFRNFRDN